MRPALGQSASGDGNADFRIDLAGQSGIGRNSRQIGGQRRDVDGMGEIFLIGCRAAGDGGHQAQHNRDVEEWEVSVGH